MKPVDTYTVHAVDKRLELSPVLGSDLNDLRDPEWPVRGHPGDAALDLCLHVPKFKHAEQKIVLRPGRTMLMSTGLCLDLPQHLMGLVLSRSGLARLGIFVVNAPGLIDPGYRGEVKVILHNLGREEHYFLHGARIAQLLVLPTSQATPIYVRDSTPRDVAGIGSTGA